MSKIFYISDTHFGHENIIRFDNRPFNNIEDMNEKIKENWNRVVSKDDVVYILGDFMWKSKDSDVDFVKSLNGRKRLIKGNHDRVKSAKFKSLFESINDYEKIKDKDRTVVLSHYPIVAYDGHYGGRNIHLYGHVHITPEYYFIKDYILKNKSDKYPMRMYNVGVMMEWMNYAPQELDSILNKFETKGENNV